MVLNKDWVVLDQEIAVLAQDSKSHDEFKAAMDEEVAQDIRNLEAMLNHMLDTEKIKRDSSKTLKSCFSPLCLLLTFFFKLEPKKLVDLLRIVIIVYFIYITAVIQKENFNVRSLIPICSLGILIR